MPMLAVWVGVSLNCIPTSTPIRMESIDDDSVTTTAMEMPFKTFVMKSPMKLWRKRPAACSGWSIASEMASGVEERSVL
ncbi:hypothetical protein BGK38_02365 [Corynebacterium diphtheriae]|uniref:Secreted protein n=1 Tax=Corynebacterium diphtheriae bv. gravis TaxID=1720349 RepID=A0AAX0J331_CORDP|nr:hypothetical protein B178_07209 [Corynebacterium diphtheriae DSM 43988]ODS20269.1 hypothetical protein BGK38_02365 [Corynebacterium diphtheriae]OEH71295.1 hypothetical protein BHU47_00505 [Corynebacterium diphtheriae]OEH71995.1 hypothetical protein BHU48_01790 [Corynebacterium diphtheriae]OKY23371.1 hypothetical protein AOT42_09225 [Corynebacterium diphtheriae bv. gravis]